jgi:hypothetical protein
MNDSMESFYLQDRADFIATPLTRGPWSPDHQHGGPPAALLGRAIERRGGEDGAFQVVRMTVEFLRPVPIGRLTLSCEVVRDGRKARILTAALQVEDREVCRATGLLLRTTRMELPPVPPAGAAPGLPEEAAPFEFPFFLEPVGYHRAVELRLARGVFGQGPATMWMRPRVPLCPGEPLSPLQRALIVADSGNGVSVVLDTARYTFVNPDLTVYLHRPPEGEWVCLESSTMPEGTGVGLAHSRLHDAQGAIGHALQSLIIEVRR